MIFILYAYGVAVNAAPIVTRTTTSKLGLRANIAEPAIARIRPIKAASGAYWWYMVGPSYQPLRTGYVVLPYTRGGFPL